MDKSTQIRVASAVDTIIRMAFPEQYFSLCHVYAIVGANVISIVSEKEYRPVAGLTVLDCGDDFYLQLTDDAAFGLNIGGAYHCWIESIDTSLPDKDFVDFTSKHHQKYVEAYKYLWKNGDTDDFIWEKFNGLVVETAGPDFPLTVPDGKVWVRETNAGRQWIAAHIEANADAYMQMTTFALKAYGMQQSISQCKTEKILLPASHPS